MQSSVAVKKWRLLLGIIFAVAYLSFGAYVLFTDESLDGRAAKWLVASFAVIAIVMLVFTKNLGRHYYWARFKFASLFFLAEWLATRWMHASGFTSGILFIAAVMSWVVGEIMKRRAKKDPGEGSASEQSTRL
jgi:hypothetical protein